MTYLLSDVDNCGSSAYEGLPLVQHPEISSTTPSTPSAVPGAYYYPVEGYEQQAVCSVPPAPYVEYEIHLISSITKVYISCILIKNRIHFFFKFIRCT